MKLAVYLADQNPHRDRTLGITEMTASLLYELASKEDLKLETIVSKSSFTMNNINVLERKLPWRTDNMIGRLLTDNLHTIVVHPDVDAWLYPKGYIPFLFRTPKPCIGIVHDTILLWYYDKYRNERSQMDYFYWLNFMKRSIARFDLILTISETAKNQILDLCERFSIAPPPIKVTYESVRYANDNDTYNRKDYVVHVASKAPHKKTSWLLENWTTRIKAGYDLPKLKLIGSVPDDSKHLVECFETIEKLPYLDDTEYKLTLAEAKALIMPSEVEGFGLPAVEAYCLGTPACYVKDTAIDEILDIPDHLGAFNLSNPESLFEALASVLQLPKENIAISRKRLQETYSVEKFGKRVISNIEDYLRQHD
jgi:glycosyltransferase involved in cell wall biosynthesis